METDEWKDVTIKPKLVRVSYPYHDLFVFSIGSAKGTIAIYLFSTRFAEWLLWFVRGSNRHRWIFGIQFLLFCYMLPVLFGLGTYIHVLYLIACYFVSLMNLPFILLLNVEVVKRLLARFEIQYSLLNTLGVVLGMAYSYENTSISIAHALTCFSSCILVTIQDDAVKRRKVLAINVLSVIVLVALQLNISQDDPAAPELKTIQVDVYSIKIITNRCLMNIMWLCVARVIMIIMNPGEFVSLKGPMVSAKFPVDFAPIVVNSLVYDESDIRYLDECPTKLSGGMQVKVVLNTQKPFEHDDRYTIGRILLGDQFASRYLYKTLQRVHSVAFVLVSFPCLIYMQIAAVSEPRDISVLDVGIMVILVSHSLSSFLFADWKIVKLSCRSLELLIFSLSVVLMSFILLAVTSASNKIFFPIYFFFIGILILVPDAHRHRWGFSMCYTTASMYLVTVLYICVTFDLIDFKNEKILLPSLSISWSLKSLFLSWTANLFLVLLRNLYSLIRLPSSYLFLKSSMRAITMTEEAADVLKTNSRHRTDLMSQFESSPIQ